MNKRFKATTAIVMASTMLAPTAVFAQSSAQGSEVSVNIEKQSVVFGTESSVSVKFKEKLNADKIVLNFKCYDMPLSAELKYNSDKDIYEGTIKIDQEPEYLNVWELQNIEVKSSNPYTLNRKDLEGMGLDLDSCNITQEVVIDEAEVQEAIANGDTASNVIQRTLARSAVPVKKMIGDNRYGTAVKVSQEGWTSANTVVIVNRNAGIAGTIATPLATTYNAPILLSSKDVVPANIINEIKRLKAKNIIIVGNTSDVSSKAVSVLSKTGAKISRISGSNNFELSLNVAKAIDKDHDVTKAYIANGSSGEIDALTIAAKAGEDKQPIILTEQNAINSSVYNWLKSENLTDAYLIGGTTVLSNNVLNKIDGIVSADVTKNRVSGSDRHETNAAVIKRFYTNKNINSLFVAKSDELIDALTCGPLAAKKKSPILINPTNYVSARHTENLNTYKAEKVYQIGGGISSKVITSISNSVSKHNSNTNTNEDTSNNNNNNSNTNNNSYKDNTVVLDAGHGGSDSGATSNGRREKDYTLDTTLATSAYLRKQGINVVLTRSKDEYISLATRAAISNEVRPELFTSIHYNSYNGSANGTEVYYNVKDKNGGLTKTAASNVLRRIVNTFGFYNRGIKVKANSSGTDYYAVLRKNKYPAMLIECAFIDNAKDMEKLNSDSKINKLGTQIGAGITETIK